MSLSKDNNQIEARRKSTEAQLQKLLANAKSTPTVKAVKEKVFHSESIDFRRFLLDLIATLSNGDLASLNDATLKVIEDAWNTFRMLLGGSCPAALFYPQPPSAAS